MSNVLSSQFGDDDQTPDVAEETTHTGGDDTEPEVWESDEHPDDVDAQIEFMKTMRSERFEK